ILIVFADILLQPSAGTQHVLAGDDVRPPPASNQGATTGGVLPPSPLPAGGPDSSFLPFFANVTNLECAQLLPSRACQPKTVTVSPGNIVSVLFQPTRFRTTGG